MKRFRSIAVAALTLGLTATAPSFAKAAPARSEHGGRTTEVRVESRVRHDEPAIHDRGGRTTIIERERVVREPVYRDVHLDRDFRDFHADRDRVRIDVAPVYVAPAYVDRDCDLSVAIGDLPACVLDAVADRGRIESARFVRHDGFASYDFIVGARDGNWNICVALDGRILSSNPC